MTFFSHAESSFQKRTYKLDSNIFVFAQVFKSRYSWILLHSNSIQSTYSWHNIVSITYNDLNDSTLWYLPSWGILKNHQKHRAVVFFECWPTFFVFIDWSRTFYHKLLLFIATFYFIIIIRSISAFSFTPCHHVINLIEISFSWPIVMHFLHRISLQIILP